MLIKVPITQIPKYWELIKTAVLNTSNISSINAAAYSKELIIDLLCKKQFCILMHKDKQIQAVCTCAFKEINNTKEKILQMHALYAIQKVSTEDWHEAMNQIKRFAKSEDCNKIYGFTQNPRLTALFDSMDFQRGSQYFVHHI